MHNEKQERLRIPEKPNMPFRKFKSWFKDAYGERDKRLMEVWVAYNQFYFGRS